MKLGGVMMLAMLSLAAFAVAGASASQPEFEGAPATFTGTQVGTGELTTFATITCTGGASSGEVNSSTTVKGVKILYTGCKEPLFGGACTSAGKNPGEIQTNALSGKTAYLVAGSSEAGIVLKPESVASFAEFKCPISGTHVVTCEVVCHATPLNTLSASGELNCTKSGSTQTPTSYLRPAAEGSEKACSVKSGVTLKDGSSTAAVKANNSVTFSKALKINSTESV
jgi:hypothetical protein